jgi:hypothetical protein
MLSGWWARSTAASEANMAASWAAFEQRRQESPHTAGLRFVAALFAILVPIDLASGDSFQAVVEAALGLSLFMETVPSIQQFAERMMRRFSRRALVVLAVCSTAIWVGVVLMPRSTRVGLAPVWVTTALVGPAVILGWRTWGGWRRG